MLTTPKEHIKRLCLIPLCKNERFDLVHKFPMDNQRAEEWRRAINIPEINNLPLELLRKRTICSKHFRKEDYKNVESRSLNKTAVPSLNFRREDQTTLGRNYVDDAAVCSSQSSSGVVKADDIGKVTNPAPATVHNKRQLLKVSTVSEQHRILLNKHVYGVRKATLFADEGPSTKHRILEPKQAAKSKAIQSVQTIRCKSAEMNLIPVTKATDGTYTVSFMPVVNGPDLDDSITLIEESPQINFVSSNAECIKIDDDDDGDEYATEIVEQLDSPCISEYHRLTLSK